MLPKSNQTATGRGANLGNAPVDRILGYEQTIYVVVWFGELVLKAAITVATSQYHSCGSQVKGF